MPEELRRGQKIPPQSERATVGGITQRIRRGTRAFETLVRYPGSDIVFKDEEGTGADRLMSSRLRDGLGRLAELVAREFPGTRLRITEAWDETGEHTSGSLHYEGRAADLTTSDRDGRKLGRLARLAVDAGLDWVFFEHDHVHVSVRKDGDGVARRSAARPEVGGAVPPARDQEIGVLIAGLEDERSAITAAGPALTDEEDAHLIRIQLALPMLEEARRLFAPGILEIAAVSPEPEEDFDDGDPAPAADAETLVGTVATSSRGNPAVGAALEALTPLVRTISHRDALLFAFRAYYAFKAARAADVRNPYLYFVDYGLDNRTRRGHVFDMARLTVVDGPFTVAHGGGSGPRNAVPTVFNNVPGKHASSLGLYLTRETYAFRGRSNGTPYRSIGLRLEGESGAFNNKARQRGVVAHGAPYVTRDDAGRSEGCPAMEERRAQRLLPLIANGGVAFLFSPADAAWMAGDPWAHHA